MKMQEIRELKLEEVAIKIEQLCKQWLEMRMQFYTNPSSVKTSELGKLRKTIARLKTSAQERNKGIRQ